MTKSRTGSLLSVELLLPLPWLHLISSAAETNRNPIGGETARSPPIYVLKMMMSNSSMKIKATIVIVLPVR